MVIDIRGKVLRDLYQEFGDQRHQLCTKCQVKSLAKQIGTCAICYVPKAWFTDGRICPRLAKQVPPRDIVALKNSESNIATWKKRKRLGN